MSSEFGRLKDPAKAATLGKLKLRLAHLNALDALGPTETWLDGVPPGTLVACLLHTTRTAARDEVVTMFCKRMATIHKQPAPWCWCPGGRRSRRGVLHPDPSVDRLRTKERSRASPTGSARAM